MSESSVNIDEKGVKIIKQDSKHPLSKNYKIEIEKDVLQQEIELRLKEKAKSSHKGFRNSASNVTLPYSLVERKYKKQIEKDVILEKANKVISDLINSDQHRLISKPDIKNFVDLEKEQKISLEVEFEVLDKVEIPDFSQISLDNFVVDIPKEEVEKYSNNIKNLSRKFLSDELFDGKNAAEGDQITIDFSMFDSVDKNKIYLKDVKDFKFDLLSGNFFSDFENYFVKSNKQDQKEFTVKFPENYSLIKSVAGKEVFVRAYVKNIKRYDKDIDENELLKMYECTSIEEFKYKISELIRSDLEKEIFVFNKAKLLQQLQSKLTFDIPPKILESEKERIMRIKKEINKAASLSTNSNSDSNDKFKLDEGYDPTEDALNRARSSMVFAEFVRENGMSMSQKEYEDYVKKEIQGKTDPQEQKKIIQECEKNKDSWTAYNLEQKAIKYIIERKVTLVEKFVTLDQVKEILNNNIPDPIYFV